MPVDVSVIVPTFQRSAEVAEAIRSALSQTGVTLEVIVRDDCPEQSARRVVAAIGDPRVRYAAHAPTSGGRPAKVRNAAVGEAAGRFIHFLDDDDRVAPGGYRALADALDRRPGVGVAFGAIDAFGPDEPTVEAERRFLARARRRAKRAFDLRVPIVAQQLFGETMLVNSSCMIRSRCVRSLGGYAEGLTLFEDVDFFTRAIWKFGGVFVDERVLERRVWASLVRRSGSAAATREAYGTIQRTFRSSEGTARYLGLKLTSRAFGLWT
jgi:glycosyltransferase involved in cell wall biosynthesis